MKTRQSFVSNSSSSSFVVWGSALDVEEFEAYLNDTKPGWDVYKYEREGEERECEQGLEEYLDQGIGHSLSTYVPEWDGSTIYIGKSPFSMKPGQTLKGYKEEIAEELTELRGITFTIKDIQAITEVYYG
jgi:hypothetical protein